MGEVAKFAAVWAANINPDKVTGILDTVDLTLRDLINKQGRKAATTSKQDDRIRNIAKVSYPSIHNKDISL